MLACGGAGFSGRQALAANSLVIGADGAILAEAGPESTTLLADVDPAAVERVGATLPVHEDRRLD